MGHKLISDPTIVVLVHSNTRTFLACQKLRGRDGLETNSTPGGTNISTSLASNVSLLDELAMRIPRIAVTQREVQTLIQKNGFQGSSEAVQMPDYPSSDGIPDKTFSMQNVNEKSERTEVTSLKEQHSTPNPFSL
ncbi:hypothetical protein BDZ45DRAFT_259389 [Acephala macrosclerotiorum]|nr:hypothetical protein BDZ45DRAFT_259389 [Acephala macrosclerotiorum]